MMSLRFICSGVIRGSAIRDLARTECELAIDAFGLPRVRCMCNWLWAVPAPSGAGLEPTDMAAGGGGGVATLFGMGLWRGLTALRLFDPDVELLASASAVSNSRCRRARNFLCGL